MNIAVLGTGIVGRTLGGALLRSGHAVRMGSRSAASPAAQGWVEQAGRAASHGTFADAAGWGELVFNCTSGTASLEALHLAGSAQLAGKVLVDVANPLDFSRGMPPSLTVCNTDSLGEQIQRAFPEARVVKALNTLNADVMVDPRLVTGGHQLFICGNDSTAKAQATELLAGFGWRAAQILDLGDISAARGTEMILPLWIRLMQTLGTAHFNFQVLPAATPAMPVAAPQHA
jgi:8-hydroxy-5-deazaflavin:NADPH oxidoreductase